MRNSWKRWMFIMVVVLTGCAMTPGQKDLPAPATTDQAAPASVAWTGSQVCIQSDCFRVEVADTDAERTQGLMHREELAQDAGMLFIFEKMRPFRAFWMKNTIIPLDMIWIDHRYRIVDITHNAQPCQVDDCPTYTPGATETKYVLEVLGGTSKALGITTGMSVEFDLHQ